MYIREFESETHLLQVVTFDFKKFMVYSEKYRKDYSLEPQKFEFSFTKDEAENIGIHGEYKISKFLEKKTGYKGIYSVTNFLKN